MDEGILTKGDRGYIITNQVSAQRFDLNIPDQVFEVNLVSNGAERVCSQRDFIKEWIYFTYPSNMNAYIFPNQTLLYNYRDKSWAIFNESYTSYGTFRPKTGFTWSTVGSQIAETWAEWDSPWNSGSSTLLQPQVIGGNQQGFVMIRNNDTGEDPSLTITGFSGSTVTCKNHCLNVGDYIKISGCVGTISSVVNGNIYSVLPVTNDTFLLEPSIGSGTYLGNGVITRMYNPFIQTKQFPLAWNMSRKTRIGVQQYLLTTTSNSQITLLLYLSQDGSNPYNAGSIVPSAGSINNSLIYSTVLYTCPESTNLGLTAANTNLQQLTAFSSSGTSSNNQSQIWHRINTSLIGDSVQLGFTMSDAQMRDVNFTNQFSEIELHGMVLDVTPSQVLA
jgi:hypothetical protein